MQCLNATAETYPRSATAETYLDTRDPGLFESPEVIIPVVTSTILVLLIALGLVYHLYRRKALERFVLHGFGPLWGTRDPILNRWRHAGPRMWLRVLAGVLGYAWVLGCGRAR